MEKERLQEYAARLQQAQADDFYRAYFGDDVWSSDLYNNGTTMEDNTKNSVIEMIENLYILQNHMADYDVTLTDDETAKIAETAAQFMADNDDKAVNALGATEDSVKEKNAEEIKKYCSEIGEINNLPVAFNNRYFRYVNQMISADQLGILGILIGLVLIGSYTVIKSIFQISIINKIQNYGQLRTIGMTQKQIKKIVKTDTAGEQTTKTVPAKKNVRRPEQRRTGNKAADSEAAAAIQKNAAKFLAFDWKYTLVALIAVIICSAAAMFYLHANAQLNVMEKQIADLKTEKTSLESKQSAIQAEIDKSINLDQIKDYAEKKLHMIYPKDFDVLLYQRDSDDYFRQYESVD